MSEYNLIKRGKQRPSRKFAIYAMCFHCFGGTADDMPDVGYQKEIGNCTDKQCPLYKYRPYQGQEFVTFTSVDEEEGE